MGRRPKAGRRPAQPPTTTPATSNACTYTIAALLGRRGVAAVRVGAALAGSRPKSTQSELSVRQSVSHKICNFCNASAWDRPLKIRKNVLMNAILWVRLRCTVRDSGRGHHGIGSPADNTPHAAPHGLCHICWWHASSPFLPAFFARTCFASPPRVHPRMRQFSTQPHDTNFTSHACQGGRGPRALYYCTCFVSPPSGPSAHGHFCVHTTPSHHLPYSCQGGRRPRALY